MGPILEALLDGYLTEYTLSYVQMAQGPMGPWPYGPFFDPILPMDSCSRAKQRTNAFYICLYGPFKDTLV